ncbi:energy-coupling factor ABC transporter ATP-binding protein [Natronomonas sp.]|uniref:energy-coupling factor ABC transporter ATP-binding protein n=1 Tax=Natronomonas sp. TaxID=2184060 RepID=UPI0026171451|nr:ABC transporter ATP-binding protein [Natronomonas sp.]
MITVRDLVHRRGDTVALEGVSLRIDDGEFLVVAGANGSGKTTLVRHLNGLLDPDEGSVSVDGTPVSEDPVAARTAVGMVFQNPRDGFVAATVGADVAFGPENLGLDREAIDRRVTAALEAVGMDGHRDRRIDRLSGGQQARVAIAGALAMEPAHLVLDEPFGGLDHPARQAVLGRLDALSAEGTGIVIVTHDLRGLFDRADRIVALSEGRIELDAAPERARPRLEALGVRPC